MTKMKMAILMSLLFVVFGCSKSSKEPAEDSRFSDKRVILQVAENKLTLGELQKRFATINFKSAEEELDAKTKYLDSFLERFLLIEGAKQSGMAASLNPEIIRRNLLNQLYNSRIMSKIDVKDSDVEAFFQKYGGEVEAGHILVADSALADSLYRELKNGVEFDKLAMEFSIDESTSKKGGTLGYFPYGRYEDKFQDAAFSMKIGEVSGPIHSRQGWRIVKVYDRIKNSRADFEKDIDRYRTTTNQYQQKTLVQAFTKEVRERYHYAPVPATLDFLIQKANSSKSSGKLPQGFPSSAYLDSSLFSPAELGMNLIQYDGGGTTVGDYIALLAQEYKNPSRAPELTDNENIQSILEGMTMPILLERMAHEEKLDKTEVYLSEIAYTEGSDLMQKMRNKIYEGAGEITEDDIVKYYNEHGQDFYLPDQIRVLGIAVKSREEAQELLDRAKRGANFIQLAKKYSVNKATSIEGGDLNYFTEARYTAIYKAATGMPLDEIGGPVEMDGNWWIFKLIGRIEKKPKELALVRSDIQSRVFNEKRQKLYDEWIANMKQKIGFTLNLDLVKSNLKVNSPGAAENSKG